MSHDLLNQYPSMDIILADLSVPQLMAIIWFGTTFAEEADKRELGVAANVTLACREQSEANLLDAVQVIHFALVYRGSEDLNSITVMKYGADCFYAWVLYAQRAWPKSPERLGYLRSLVQPALACCSYDGTGETVDHITEMLSNYGSFWDAEHREAVSSLLRSPWGQQRMVELQAEHPESTSFARLLLAYGDVAVQDIIQNPNNFASQQIMGMSR